MDVSGKTVAITGAAQGIGAALARAAHHHGAKSVACLDVDDTKAQQVAHRINGLAVKVDVGDEADLTRAIDTVEAQLGPIDLFCSNAGVLTSGGVALPDDTWDRMWRINVMSHVWAARRLIPGMIERGGGHLLNTASAAGVLNQIGSAPYGVTKHAAVGLAEWLAMTHGDDGIGVSCLCPQGVRTPMIKGHEDHAAAADGILEPEEVAEAAIQGIKDGVFLILPHEKVRDYMALKANDYERWLGGMRKLNRGYHD
ncbi:SDR family oxidoreductase [uncultured Tateyamaria sp.]|uniref:SDR family oxidoreductase n=1 Tax=Tateyamaria sp. 1078 TaxID=3417464 RepID=UPI00260F6398|nr:SDR family oxidoreductase [uncultured Tateyamaria sp.]